MHPQNNGARDFREDISLVLPVICGLTCFISPFSVTGAFDIVLEWCMSLNPWMSFPLHLTTGSCLTKSECRVYRTDRAHSFVVPLSLPSLTIPCRLRPLLSDYSEHVLCLHDRYFSVWCMVLSDTRNPIVTCLGSRANQVHTLFDSI